MIANLFGYVSGCMCHAEVLSGLVVMLVCCNIFNVVFTTHTRAQLTKVIKHTNA